MNTNAWLELGKSFSAGGGGGGGVADGAKRTPVLGLGTGGRGPQTGGRKAGGKPGGHRTGGNRGGRKTGGAKARGQQPTHKEAKVTLETKTSDIKEDEEECSLCCFLSTILCCPWC